MGHQRASETKKDQAAHRADAKKPFLPDDGRQPVKKRPPFSMIDFCPVHASRTSAPIVFWIPFAAAEQSISSSLLVAFENSLQRGGLPQWNITNHRLPASCCHALSHRSSRTLRPMHRAFVLGGGFPIFLPSIFLSRYPWRPCFLAPLR
jgi:hypothetical protein